MAGRTDYAINGGSVFIPHGPGPASASAAASNTWPNLAALGFNGIASVHSQITEAMIADKKQTTYLIGEKYMSPENYITGIDSTVTQNDPGDLFSAMSGDDVSLIRWGNPNLMPNMDRLSTNNPPPVPSQIFGSCARRRLERRLLRRPRPVDRLGHRPLYAHRHGHPQRPRGGRFLAVLTGLLDWMARP